MVRALIHLGLGNPVENASCPVLVLKGLLELEAAIFIPLALQALITCVMIPPPNFVCSSTLVN
ncbi:hypothetical protein SAY86_003298 [Trapa natans]|uniref:Uncharacterized protein n=1 Tax=Trapa natans TaxID=22666 RepID=A0AAN7N1G0_TRANT|nr:hypothetical protein SAY86_003298 [Trapa natans]